MNDKERLFSALDELHEIMCEWVRPANKETWKEWVWEHNKNKSHEDFERLIDDTIAIARYEEDSDEQASAD